MLTELGHGLCGGVADAVVATDPVGFLNLVAVELDAPDAVRLHRSAAVPAQPTPFKSVPAGAARITRALVSDQSAQHGPARSDRADQKDQIEQTIRFEQPRLCAKPKATGQDAPGAEGVEEDGALGVRRLTLHIVQPDHPIPPRP